MIGRTISVPATAVPCTLKVLPSICPQAQSRRRIQQDQRFAQLGGIIRGIVLKAGIQISGPVGLHPRVQQVKLIRLARHAGD